MENHSVCVFRPTVERDSGESRHTETSLQLTRLPILRLRLLSESQAKTSENLKDREKRQMASKEPQLGKHLISPQGSCGSSKAGQPYHRSWK